MKTSKYILILFLLLSTNAKAAEQLYHPSSSFKSGTNKLYFPANKIVLQNATSSINALEVADGKGETILLKNVGLNNLSNVAVVDTELVRKKGSKSVVYFDPIPPVLTFQIDAKYTKKGIFYNNKETRIDLTAKDSLSGIAAIYLSINNEPFVKTESTFSITKEGFNEILVYAVDNVGNASVPRFIKLVLNSTTPKTELLVAPNIQDLSKEIVISPRSHFILNDLSKSEQPSQVFAGISSTYYSIDNSKPVLYKAPVSNLKLKAGSHQLKFYAVDNIGNKEEQQLVNFYIDSLAPSVTAKVVGPYVRKDNRNYLSSNSQIELVASDDKSGLLENVYTLNKGDNAIYRSAITPADNKIYQTLTYYALDFLGNKSKKASYSFLLDDLAPTPALKFRGAHYMESPLRHFVRNTTDIIASCDDELVGTQDTKIKMDGGSWQDAVAPFKITQRGLVIINIECTDKLGNTMTSADFSIYVDEAPPAVEFLFNEPKDKNEKYPTATKLSLVANDSQAGVDKVIYQVNNGKPQQYKAQLSFAKADKYDVFVTIFDKVGNKKTDKISVLIAN